MKGKKEINDTGNVKHHRQRSGLFFCVLQPNECRDTQHPTWRIKEGSGGWETEACTTSGVLLIYSGELTVLSV